MDKTVLIVEDSPTQAINLQAALETTGLQVICATDGLMGLRRAAQIKSDLIILDVVMPGIDGFQVIEVLKGNPETASIPIVILSRTDRPEAIQLGERLGVVEFIPKDAFAVAVLMGTMKQMGLIE